MCVLILASIFFFVLFLTAHLKKLMCEEKCSAGQVNELEDVITQVCASQTHMHRCVGEGIIL